MGNVPAGGFRRFRFQLTKSGSQQPSGRFAVILTVFRVAGAKLAQRLVDLSLDKVRPVSQRGGVWRLSEDDCVPHRHTAQLPHMTQAEAPRHFPDLRHDSHIHVFLFPRASQQVHDLLTTGPQVARPHAHELPLPLRRVPPRLLAPSLAPSRAVPHRSLAPSLADPPSPALALALWPLSSRCSAPSWCLEVSHGPRGGTGAFRAAAAAPCRGSTAAAAAGAGWPQPPQPPQPRSPRARLSQCNPALTG